MIAWTSEIRRDADQSTVRSGIVHTGEGIEAARHRQIVIATATGDIGGGAKTTIKSV